MCDHTIHKKISNVHLHLSRVAPASSTLVGVLPLLFKNELFISSCFVCMHVCVCGSLAI